MNVKRRNYFKKTKRKKSTHSSHASGRKCASFGVENALTGQHDEEETAAAAAAVAAAAARRAGTRRRHRGGESEAKGRSRRSKEKEKHGKRGGVRETTTRMWQVCSFLPVCVFPSVSGLIVCRFHLLSSRFFTCCVYSPIRGFVIEVFSLSQGWGSYFRQIISGKQKKKI